MIEKNIRKILDTIQIHSPYPEKVTLVAVTKNRSVSEIREAIRCGVKVIGENRVQESEEKFALLGALSVQKHFIGHLQTNKVNKAVELFDMIESVDSERLAGALNVAAKATGKVLPVLIQVNIARDPRKFGIFEENMEDFLKKALLWPHLKIQGFMTIGRLEADEAEQKKYFQALHSLFEQMRTAKFSGMDLQYLSMGMSGDFIPALECGATMIRIGSGIFD
ncbi:YggS family pyridoxal phosphate-dependent enzyme [Candidatus Peregrinibacteria bacterium]|nr:YggS family pyridoxal phosphate-dependent enzyme [Candidatus Peregrinibacteria bacterium]